MEKAVRNINNVCFTETKKDCINMSLKAQCSSQYELQFQLHGNIAHLYC